MQNEMEKQDNYIAQPKTWQCLSSPPHFSLFLFFCFLLFWSLINGMTPKICMLCFHLISTDTECVNTRPMEKGQWKQLTIKLRMAASGYRLIQGGLPLSMWMRTQADAHRSEGNPWPSLAAFSGLQWAGEPVGKRLGGAWSWGICWAAPKSARTISVVPSLTSRLSAAPMPSGIIMKGFSVVPIYCARWECSALLH